MATPQDSLPPRARACINSGWRYSEQFSSQRCAAFSGFLSGITLGMALGQLDPEWARLAYDELVDHAVSLSAASGVTPERKRLETWREARRLLDASSRVPRGEDGEH